MERNMLICYKFEKIDPVKRKQFDRKMFGTVEKTHKGKYQSITKGVLEGISYRKPVRSVLIISKKHIKKVMGVFKEFSTKTEIFEIVPF
jgi:hypothetical protein